MSGGWFIAATFLFSSRTDTKLYIAQVHSLCSNEARDFTTIAQQSSAQQQCLHKLSLQAAVPQQIFSREPWSHLILNASQAGEPREKKSLKLLFPSFLSLPKRKKNPATSKPTVTTPDFVNQRSACAQRLAIHGSGPADRRHGPHPTMMSWIVDYIVKVIS